MFEFRYKSNSPGNSQASGKAKTALKTATTVLKEDITSDKAVPRTPGSEKHSDLIAGKLVLNSVLMVDVHIHYN